ncbi:MAG: GH32 C-terminal domain-containing protein, partial [Verrucomicrobiaceae bacterium]
IHVDVRLGSTSGFGVIIRGHSLTFDAQTRKFNFLGRDVEAQMENKDNRIRFRLLVDRTSVELFASEGSVASAFTCLPEARDWPLEFFAKGGDVKIVSLCVHELRSIWK